MFSSKKALKFLASSLIIVMMVSNLACAAAVNDTQATPNKGDSLNKITYSVDKSNGGQVATADNQANEQLTDQEKELRFTNSLLNYYLQNGKKQGPEWLKTTEFQFDFTEDHKPIYSLETLQPFGGIREDGPFWFWQGRYAHESEDSSTANLGVGWRKLSDDKTSMIGLNMFYDYGFQYDLSRIGLGTEYFNKLTEYRFNYYHPLSSDRQTGVSYLTSGILTSYIRAVEGLDFETGTSFTHLPWLKVYAGGYYWDNKYSADEKGYRLRSTLQLTPRINMELGYNNSNVTHDWYGEIKYQLADGFVPSLFGDERSSKFHSNDNDISNKLMQKVERENDIKTETYTKFVSYQGSIRTTVTNTNNSTPLVGVTVQAYQNGTAVGSAATTDASGNAVISGLNVGTYTMYATYGSYTGTSNAVTVTKDQTAAASVSLAVLGGSAAITVVDANSQPVSGASVTATLTNTTVAKAERSLVDQILGVQSAYAATSPFNVTATTNSSGVANFTNLPAGTYSFAVSESGASMTSQAVGVSSGRTNAVTVMVSTTGGDIQVIAKDSNGTVLSGVAVQVLSGSAVVATGKTDKNGVALIGGIAAGTYKVVGSLSSYDSTPVTCTVANGATTGTALVLTPQDGSATVAMTFSDGATNITPVFTLDGTTNTIKPTGTPSISNGVLTYTFTGLAVGTHKIYVSAAGYSVITSPSYSSVTITDGATTAGSGITLAEDAPAPAPTPTTGSVAITVTFSDGATTVTPSFYIDGSSTATQPTRTTAASGGGNIYTFSGLTIGTQHTIVASATNYTANRSATVSATTGTPTPVTITLISQTGSAAITVTFSDGATAVTPSFYIDGSSTATQPTTTTAASGGGNIYTFSGLTIGTQHTIVASATNYTANTAVTVSATTGTPTPVTITLISQTGSAAITVTFSDGATAVTPSFYLDTSTAMTPITHVTGGAVSTNPDGTTSCTYTISGIAAGSHNITVKATNYVSIETPAPITFAAGTNVTANLTLATTITTGDVTITATNSADGTIPLKGLKLTLTGPDGAAHQKLTGNMGEAQFTGLPAGQYVARMYDTYGSECIGTKVNIRAHMPTTNAQQFPICPILTQINTTNVASLMIDDVPLGEGPLTMGSHEGSFISYTSRHFIELTYNDTTQTTQDLQPVTTPVDKALILLADSVHVNGHY